jgi:hypothetical protein
MSTTDDVKGCGAKSPGRFRCTRAAGHDGDHQAHDHLGALCDTWPRDRREQVIAGLRELATFLEDHPDLPVPKYEGARMPIHTGHEVPDGPAEVDKIAAILGVKPVQGNQRTAAKVFSGGVVYEAVHIPALQMAEYRALNSYAGRVQPEPAGAAT